MNEESDKTHIRYMRMMGSKTNNAKTTMTLNYQLIFKNSLKKVQ